MAMTTNRNGSKTFGISGAHYLLTLGEGTKCASTPALQSDRIFGHNDVDETYLRVKGRWCYLYRAIDREGNLVDSMLSATRDMAAAQRFFRGTLSVVKRAPQQVTSDGHDSNPRAIREELGRKVEHRCSAFLNRRIEQDHRGVKQRYYPMLSFGAFHSAQRFCRAFEEMRQHFRPRRKKKAIRVTRTL